MSPQPAHNPLHRYADVAQPSRTVCQDGARLRAAIQRRIQSIASPLLHDTNMEERMSHRAERQSAHEELLSAFPETLTPQAIRDDVRRIIIAVGGNRTWDDTRESWLHRAAWKLGMPYPRVRRLFYREVQNIPAHEYLHIKSLARMATE